MTQRIEEGSIILSPADMRIIYGPLRIRENRARAGSTTRLGQILTEMSICAFHSPADRGKESRRDTASEERDYWTVRQVSRATRRAERTVRLDCQEGRLPAIKNPTWLIRDDDARSYIAGNRST
ncbi:hypothetical protein [Microbacterium imperiale]|uniref:Helix-turn-helix domain-containing protein n=1 Tax=Microbacterium imperiale TaxID=33884 RepID=A0A9W6M361_9MICO|nr:hypothetical protein [Microbacterium imperiale]MBP2422069.1 hypothetical protein [Microbacterium imperiale]MDS0200226.1 hypothetical protein [Microbacterium imperiale]BFE39378.1 hypothetical protein GCM10017544_03340 [Microbacterium imperiale]GLJ79755.1 hypothetical protein GCM10017586_14370 [Microbacterium imperiale]